MTESEIKINMQNEIDDIIKSLLNREITVGQSKDKIGLVLEYMIDELVKLT